MRSTFDRRDAILASSVAIAAFAISVAGSGNASFWGDEAASVLSAQRSLPSLASMIQHVDAVHALYYVGLHFWINLFGASPFSVRFPSAVAVGLAAAGIVLVGRLLKGLLFGLIAGVIAAVLPRMTGIGSEARSFAMTALIATLLTLVLVLVLRREGSRRRLWIAYGALLAVGTILFIWLALIAVAHLVVVIIARVGEERTRGVIVEALVTIVGAMIVASPVLILAVLERRQIAYLGERQLYDLDSLFISPWFASPIFAAFAWAAVLAGVPLTVRSMRSQSGRVRAELLLPLAWMVVPMVVLLAITPLIAVYTPRYLAMCAPAVALTMAIPIEALASSKSAVMARRAGAIVGLVAMLALVAPVWFAQRGPYAKNDSDWAEISARLASRAQPGDAVAFDDTTRPSRRTRLAYRTYPAGFVGLLDPTLKTPYWENSTWYDDTYTLAQAQKLGRLDGVRRIWLVEYAISGIVDTDGIAALEAAGFRRVSTSDNHRSSILEFICP